MTISSATLETIFDRPDAVADRYVTADGYRTHYLEAGDPSAPPLLLVHGGACEIGMGVDRWYPTILPLSKNFHVFAVDEVGHGYTDPPRDLADLANVRVRAEHVIAFIEALGVGPVHLLGQSQGGWIVNYITIMRPDLVTKLVLVDSGSASGSGLTKAGRPFHREVFEPGTMIPKHDLRTREGIRDYVSTFCYDKAMVNEHLLDRLLPLSERWNDMYMEHIRSWWRDPELGLQKKIDMYSINGTHLKDMAERIAPPTL